MKYFHQNNQENATFFSISIRLYAKGHGNLYVCFLAGFRDLIMICRRFLNVVDIESNFKIFYHFNQKFLGKKGKIRDFFVYYLFLKFKLIEYFYGEILNAGF